MEEQRNPNLEPSQYTVQDRLDAQALHSAVNGARDDIQEVKEILKAGMTSHDERLKSLETDKIKRDDRSRRKMSVLKIASLVGGFILVILGVAHAVHIL